MVGKNQIKQIKSLHQKKNRWAEKAFIVEGYKTINTLLEHGLKLLWLGGTADQQHRFVTPEFHELTPQQLKQVSAMTTPPGSLAVFAIPDSASLPTQGWVVAIDEVQDPGNLGTIIRLCDWFGIADLVCSKGTVDVYNPKTVQASMGSLARVKVHYTELTDWLSQTDLPIYGTMLDGQSIYELTWPEQGVLLLGNEANGISAEVIQLIHHQITIPATGHPAAESLNVAMATGLCLGALRHPIKG
ncbi:MAG: RNA methyltransferase [Flavobacteriaceae bacterium]